MKLKLTLFLALSVQLLYAEDKGLRWSTIDPFCGQVTSAEPEAFPIKSAILTLYRAKAKHLPCCESAEKIGTVQIDEGGNFDLRKIAPGHYWLIAAWAKTEVPIALWVEGKKRFACDERYKNIIAIRPSTKTAEGTVVVAVDELTHATTH